MPPPARAVCRGVRFGHRFVATPLVRLLRADVTGAEHVPGHGGVLLAANHRSFLDHFVVSGASPRPVWFLGKAELASGVFGRMNAALGMIPVQRGTADFGALDVVVDLLRAGEVVGVFPEGTRSPTGELFRFRSGVARVAAASGAPVVPVGLRGTGEVWPKGERPPLVPPPRGRISVEMGEVIGAPDADPRSRRAFTEDLFDRIAALSGQRQAGCFAPSG